VEVELETAQLLARTAQVVVSLDETIQLLERAAIGSGSESR